MRNYKQNKISSQRGQAIMEMIVIIIALVACIVGMLAVMNLSFANIEILMGRKTDAELEAHNQVYGSSGKEISKWNYTTFGNKSNAVQIPFSPHDVSSRQSGNLVDFQPDINAPEYSDAVNENYVFNDFILFVNEMDINFASTPMYIQGHRAANLHKGNAHKFGNSNLAQKHLDLANIFLESRVNISRIIDSPGNQVYMPSMRVKSTIK